MTKATKKHPLADFVQALGTDIGGIQRNSSETNRLLNEILAKLNETKSTPQPIAPPKAVEPPKPAEKPANIITVTDNTPNDALSPLVSRFKQAVRFSQRGKDLYTSYGSGVYMAELGVPYQAGNKWLVRVKKETDAVWTQFVGTVDLDFLYANEFSNLNFNPDDRVLFEFIALEDNAQYQNRDGQGIVIVAP